MRNDRKEIRKGASGDFYRKIKKNRTSYQINKLPIITILGIILMGLIMIFNQKNTLGGIHKTYHSECIGFKSVQIKKGDTLYSLSEEYCSKSINQNSLRNRFIEDVIQLNNLDVSGKIYAGGYLMLPIYN